MTVPDALRPPASHRGFRPVTHTLKAGGLWLRMVQAHHLNALGTGPVSRTRYASPAIDRAPPGVQDYNVLYFGATYRCCFVEAILRDNANGAFEDWPVSERELDTWDCMAVKIEKPLRVVDMRGPGLLAMRIPTDVARATPHQPGRLWSEYLYRHPDGLDGIIYRSRLCDDDCVAFFADRADSALSVVERRRVLAWEDEFEAAASLFRLALVP